MLDQTSLLEPALAIETRRPSPDPERPAAFTIHIDVDEEALCSGRGTALHEQADFVADGAVADAADGDAGLHFLREGHGAGVGAAGFHDEADHRPLFDIEQAMFHQPGVHGRIEEAVIDDVVDMTVDVIVHPAGRDGAPGLIVSTRAHFPFASHKRLSPFTFYQDRLLLAQVKLG